MNETNEGSLEANGMQWSFWTTSIDQRTADADIGFDRTVAIADGLATRPYYEITLGEAMLRYSATIRLQYEPKLERVVTRSCEFIAEDLKVSDFHKFPIEKTLRYFNPVLFGYVEDQEHGRTVFGPLSTGQQLLQKIDGGKLKKAGPTNESLLWVNRICAIAEMNRLPPTKTLSEIIGLPLRTASHWVKLMRERVKPTYKTGEIVQDYGIGYIPQTADADDVFFGNKTLSDVFGKTHGIN
ncbi:hypothetical protein [Bifidobacterium crudilactis]|jgi:sigma-E factor negative regulatory protein RseB|uniref:hypothetical protein n=1 Tax=Bifidobacterium crudilactis TaxID=327277 RepID=UPI0023572ED9|nr:hypothetical protein [Bifidobacterium crudilactis]MCI2157426.1 hypothetical protein [Bifidobacterium crudilactis]